MSPHGQDLPGQPESSQDGSGGSQFVAGRTALEGQNHAICSAQRITPLDESAQGSEGPSRHDVIAFGVLFGAPTDDDGVSYPQVLHSLGKEVEPAEQGLQQGHLEVGSEHGQGDARYAGATTDVDDRAALG